MQLHLQNNIKHRDSKTLHQKAKSKIIVKPNCLDLSVLQGSLLNSKIQSTIKEGMIEFSIKSYRFGQYHGPQGFVS